jgi:5-hydroxyisourate hydrolase
MSAITTHVLDTARGRPAAGVPVRLEQWDGLRDEWTHVGRGETDADGRLRTLMPSDVRLGVTFDTRTYFAGQSVPTLYPIVVIVFETTAGETHYHVPLLLGAFGYTTYRGS